MACGTFILLMSSTTIFAQGEKTVLESWTVKDKSDQSSHYEITVYECTEMGNQSKPGLQVLYMGRYVNFEPIITTKWYNEAKKKGVNEYLLPDDNSYTYRENKGEYVKIYLVCEPLSLKVEVKTTTSKPVIKTFELPFTIEQ